MAQREHSRAELQRKLLAAAAAATQAGRGQDRLGPVIDEDAAVAAAAQRAAEVTQVLDDLERQGWLSDARAADAVLLAKSPRYGSRRLKQWLQAKSLDPLLVAGSLAQARETEFDRAQAVWLRRFGEPPADLRQRARQQRFLAGRGFEPAVIERVLKSHASSGRSTSNPED